MRQRASTARSTTCAASSPRTAKGLGVTFDRLDSITTALNDSRGDIKQVLHITPTVFQNFMNIYQPAQSAVTGILAPVNFANTVQFICSAIEAASRQGFETVVEAVCPVPGADHQEPPVQLPAARHQPVRGSVGAAQRDHLQRRPAESASAAAARMSRRRWTPPPDRCLQKRRFRPPPATPTDPSQGLQGLMVPPRGHTMRRMLAAALVVACLSAIPGCEWRGLNSLSLPGTEGSGDGSYTIQAQLPDVVSSSRTPGCASPTSTSATSPRSRCRTGMPW